MAYTHTEYMPHVYKYLWRSEDGVVSSGARIPLGIEFRSSRRGVRKEVNTCFFLSGGLCVFSIASLH